VLKVSVKKGGFTQSGKTEGLGIKPGYSASSILLLSDTAGCPDARMRPRFFYKNFQKKSAFFRHNPPQEELKTLLILCLLEKARHLFYGCVVADKF